MWYNEKIKGREQNLQKIMVIGCPGAGKSTFARKLRDKTGLPLFYLDMLWHKPDKTTVSRAEFDRSLSEILEKERWIIDGNYGRTLEVRLKACDKVFLFDLPTDVCLLGAAARIGTKREDMPWVEENFDPEFKAWIENFKRDEMPHVYLLLERYKTKDITVFHSRSEADEYLTKITKEKK